MNPRHAPNARFSEIRALLGAPGQGGVLARYRIGARFARIKAEDGPGALAELTEELGWDRVTVYRYFVVAECWREEELVEILRRAAAAGTAITWSHLILISSCPSASERAALIERVIHEGLSVRALTDSLRTPQGIRGRVDRTSLERLRSVAEVLRQEGDRAMASAKNGPSEEAAELLDALIEVSRRIHATSARHLRRFESARERARKAERDEEAPRARNRPRVATVATQGKPR